MATVAKADNSVNGVSEPIRVELKESLVGHHVYFDSEQITLGLLEDLQTLDVRGMLDSLAPCVVGGDLPKGIDRAGLRRLTMSEFRALATGLNEAMAVPKAT